MALYFGKEHLRADALSEAAIGDFFAETDALIEGVGRRTGCWCGQEECVLYFYGDSLPAMRKAFEPLIDRFGLHPDQIIEGQA
jgi:hypothetical protein